MQNLNLRRTLLATAAVLAVLPSVVQARCDKLAHVKAGEVNIIVAT